MNSPYNYGCYGIASYYSIRPRAEGEETHPIIIEEVINTPFILFKKILKAKVFDKKAGRINKMGIDTYKDVENYALY
jgi:hypothetical protein